MREFSLTFNNGQSLSNEYIDCSQGLEKAIGLMFAVGYNTTNCTFEAYDADGNAYSVKNLDGAELEYTISQTVASYYPLDPTIFAGIGKFRVRRGTQASPYTTGAENSAIKVIRRVY